jgi:hypothetical protein
VEGNLRVFDENGSIVDSELINTGRICLMSILFKPPRAVLGKCSLIHPSFLFLLDVETFNCTRMINCLVLV